MNHPDSPLRPADGFAPTGSRPATEWPDSTRPSELRSSVFGSTLFDSLAAGPIGVRPPPSVFDVCHVGVVLRAVLFVNAVVGIGALFAARGFAAWLALATVGSAVALPGVLLWLLAACLLKAPLSALPLGAQWAAATSLGAVSGLFGWALGWSTGLDLFDTGHWLAPALAGAAMAASIFQWLRLRAQAKLPADTTAKLAELQSRIRPHFLFNTLNTALSLVRLDPARAEGVLEDLAELFRVALTDTGESVTLAEEVELAQRYLAIEQIRFGDRLQVSWELDAEAGAARVPPLLLQPLVENAVRHGVEPAPEGGLIRVRTRMKMGRAVVSIVNTVSQEPSRPGNGIALRNVRERLRLMHDVAAQFDTRRDRDVFRVQIVVPI
ncbi:sensor histidine kinase [Piscinibacter sp.]|uniref:sensor histidine kinase n=1 Tax=Piscinibacter sp. TaxID=1903157 RepID=UPI002CF02C25|nr:histidine kinase [Albitalea sp.]HUG22561.1 histidine kinase [Albitalea sp.]